MSLDSEMFLKAMRQVAQPVTIVTVQDANGLYGMTASSFTSISLDPPLVLISVGETNTTCRRIESVGNFAVNVLGAEQSTIGETFSRTGMEKNASFSRIPHRSEVTGAPIFQDCVSWFDCSVFAKQQAGSGVLFIGLVEAAGLGTDDVPLLYRNRAYEPHHSP